MKNAKRGKRKAAALAMARQAGVTIAAWKAVKQAKPAGLAALMTAALAAL